MKTYQIPIIIAGMIYSISGCGARIVERTNEFSNEQIVMLEAALNPENWLLRKVHVGDTPSEYIANEGLEPYDAGNQALYNELSRLHRGNKIVKGPRIGENGKFKFGNLVSLLSGGTEMYILDINGDGLAGSDYNKKLSQQIGGA